MKLPSGRKAFRAVDHRLDAGRLERRNPRHRLAHVLLEMVPVVVEQLELEGVRHVARPPGLRVGLVAADHQPAHFLLEVGQAIGIAHGGEARGHAVDRLGDHVLVLHRLQRHADAGQRAELAGPLAGAVHELVAGHRAGAGMHFSDPAAIRREAGDAHALDDPGAVVARALGQRQRDVGRVGLAVARQKRGADEVGDFHQRPHGLHFGGAQELHVEAEALGGGGQPLELHHALVVAGEP
jgi:hypothetical protein